MLRSFVAFRRGGVRDELRPRDRHPLAQVTEWKGFEGVSTAPKTMNETILARDIAVGSKVLVRYRSLRLWMVATWPPLQHVQNWLVSLK